MEARRLAPPSGPFQIVHAIQQGTSEDSYDVIHLSDEVVRGWETNVHFYPKEKRVVRDFHRFGRVWRKPSFRKIRGQIESLVEEGCTSEVLVPLDVLGDQLVESSDGVRRVVDVLMVQHLFDSKVLTSSRVFNFDQDARRLYELALLRDEVRGNCELVMDLTGGQAVTALLSGLNPFKAELEFEFANLLMAEGEHTAHRDWPLFDLEEGDLIARPGEVRLCDPGVYDYGDDKRSFKDRIIFGGMRHFEGAQDVVIGRFLRELGYERYQYDSDSTFVRRGVARLMESVMPKIRLAADRPA